MEVLVLLHCYRGGHICFCSFPERQSSGTAARTRICLAVEKEREEVGEERQVFSLQKYFPIFCVHFLRISLLS